MAAAEASVAAVVSGAERQETHDDQYRGNDHSQDHDLHNMYNDKKQRTTTILSSRQVMIADAGDANHSGDVDIDIPQTSIVTPFVCVVENGDFRRVDGASSASVVATTVGTVHNDNGQQQQQQHMLSLTTVSIITNDNEDNTTTANGNL